MNDEKFITRQPKESEFKSILEFIDKDFLPRERLSIACGLRRNQDSSKVDDHSIQQEHDDEPYEDDRFIPWLLDGVSLIAVDKEDGTLAGVAVNFVVRKDHHEVAGNDKVPERLKALLQFIEKLEEGHNLFNELNTDKGLDLRFLGVKEKYSRQGIARKLTEESLEIAKKQKLKFVQSIPTSPATLHLFESLGFKTRSEKRCIDSHTEDGKPSFPYADPEDIARYVVKIF